MEVTEEVQLHTTGNHRDQNSNKIRKLQRYTRWIRIGFYALFLVCGQSAATLLGRLYYDKGGNSKWMATLVQSAGFPILLPLLCFFTQPTKSSPKQPNFLAFAFICFAFGVLLIGDNLMYSYGLLYLPVSTYSLLCATQLAFNALFSFFLNAQKLSPYILNSLVLLTVSASLLALNSNSDPTTHSSKGKYIIGFICTLGASAAYSLYLCLLQVCFEKVFKGETFATVLDMQIYPSFVASCGCVVGLFGSGEWRGLGDEMKGYGEGKVSYVMTLVWTAVAWQVSSIGLLGLIFEVSSLFSNVISTLALPVVPILAVMFFHDKMNGMKAMALVLALWGFVSYVYHNYLHESKAKATLQSATDINAV
ncbi:Purine permease 21, partial [Cucurbita argyrosperma subsp. sororia]